MTYFSINSGLSISIAEDGKDIILEEDQSGSIHRIPESQAVVNHIKLIGSWRSGVEFFDQHMMGMFESGKQPPEVISVMKIFPEFRNFTLKDLTNPVGITLRNVGRKKWDAAISTKEKEIACSPGCAIFLSILKGVRLEIEKATQVGAKRSRQTSPSPQTTDKVEVSGRSKKSSRKETTPDKGRRTLRLPIRIPRT